MQVGIECVRVHVQRDMYAYSTSCDVTSLAATCAADVIGAIEFRAFVLMHPVGTAVGSYFAFPIDRCNSGLVAIFVYVNAVRSCAPHREGGRIVYH